MWHEANGHFFCCPSVFAAHKVHPVFSPRWESLVAKRNVKQLRGSSMSKYQNVKKSIFCIGDPKTKNMLFLQFACLSLKNMFDEVFQFWFSKLDIEGFS